MTIIKGSHNGLLGIVKVEKGTISPEASRALVNWEVERTFLNKVVAIQLKLTRSLPKCLNSRYFFSEFATSRKFYLFFITDIFTLIFQKFKNAYNPVLKIKQT